MKVRKCNICEKPASEVPIDLGQQKCLNCSNLRRCYICKDIKELEEFAKDSTKKTGRGNRCRKCSGKRKPTKSEKYYERRRNIDKRRKSLPQRKLRLFIHDCFRRLKRYKDSSVKYELGFTKEEFISKFPEVPEGKHIDHCIPLSWFKEETPINISCNLNNLQILDSFVNQKKKNIFCHKPSDDQYVKDIIPFIKEKWLDNVKNLL